jgi:hypothetical protein
MWSDELLPPAVTHRTGTNADSDRGAPLAPPFRRQPSKPGPTPQPAVTTTATEAAPPILPRTDTTMSWVAPSAEGEVEPTFEGDLSLTPPPAPVTSDRPREAFPIDAFIITEETKVVPTGMAPEEVEAVKQQTEHPPHDAAHDAADRLEKLSRRLRAEDLEPLMRSLAQGDRFDTLLAAFLTGYFSKQDA